MEKPEIVQLPCHFHNSCSPYQNHKRFTTPIPKLTISGYIHPKKPSAKIQKKLSLDFANTPTLSNAVLNGDSILTPRINYIPKINPGKHYRKTSSHV